jgi:hypothetical protein
VLRYKLKLTFPNILYISCSGFSSEKAKEKRERGAFRHGKNDPEATRPQRNSVSCPRPESIPAPDLPKPARTKSETRSNKSHEDWKRKSAGGLKKHKWKKKKGEVRSRAGGVARTAESACLLSTSRSPKPSLPASSSSPSSTHMSGGRAPHDPGNERPALLDAAQRARTAGGENTHTHRERERESPGRTGEGEGGMKKKRRRQAGEGEARQEQG